MRVKNALSYQEVAILRVFLWAEFNNMHKNGPKIIYFYNLPQFFFGICLLLLPYLVSDQLYGVCNNKITTMGQKNVYFRKKSENIILGRFLNITLSYNFALKLYIFSQ